MKGTFINPIASACARLLPDRIWRTVKVPPGMLVGCRYFLRGLTMGRSFPGIPEAEDRVMPETRAGDRTSENPLERYFDANRTGRGIWKWRHYFEIYHRHFARFVGRQVRILEVGIYSGGSLLMWRDYFGPHCAVHGVDIAPACKAHEKEGVHVHIGDQADRCFWRRLKREQPPFDIIVDDGGHLPTQQIVTLEEMLPHIRPGGIYLCEDIHGEMNPFNSYLAGLVASFNAWPSQRRGERATINSLQRDIAAIHMYPFVVAIELRDEPLRDLQSCRCGTVWATFLEDPGERH